MARPLQMPFAFALPQVAWKPPDPSTWFSWQGAKRVSIDFETNDELLDEYGPGVRRGAYVAGIAVAIEDGPEIYLPVRHEGGDNVDEAQAWKWFDDNIREYDGTVAGANLGYELDYLMHRNTPLQRVKKWRDAISVAAPLVDELQDRYGLDAVCEREGLPGKDERILRHASGAYGVHAKKHLWRLPARYVAQYAMTDARRPLQVLRRLERKIEEQDLWSIYDLETDLLPVLVKMRRRGVLVDLDHCDRTSQWALAQEREHLAKLWSLSGVRLSEEDTWKAAALAPALIAAGIEVPLAGEEGEKYSITKDWLNALKHPAADAVREAREFNKLRTTFCERVKEYAVRGEGGWRVHVTFNQLRKSKDDPEEDDASQGARFGRVSSSDYNIQQEPIRNKKFGKRWRSVYKSDKGKKWVSLDFSQQEPRLAVHYADLTGCRGAAEFARRYREDPNTDFHNMTSEVTLLPRSDAKNTGLGLMYGMGGAKLCRDKLLLPTEWIWSDKWKKMIEVAGPEGKAKLDQFHAGVPWIKLLSYKCQDRVKEVGYIVTLLKRRCRFPKDDHGNWDWLHKALNRLIQGGAADQTKLALVEADRMGAEIQLQVHDEFDFCDTEDYAMTWRLKDMMEHVVELRVPTKVDVEAGDDWGDIHTIERMAA